MSRLDFEWPEFQSRREATRRAMAEAGYDWFVAIHPVAIHWLTGSDAKSYQEFQCLLIGSDRQPVTILTRAGEANEFRDDAWVDEIVPWGGGIIEDPVAAFERLAARLGLLDARVAIEVPAYYLHAHHYLGLRRVLGDALVAEDNRLVHQLKLVKSPAELAMIGRATEVANGEMERFASALRRGRSELEIAADVYHYLIERGGGLAASPMNLVSGERSCFSHGAPTARRLRDGDFGGIEYGATHRRYTATIGRQFCVGPPTSRMRELYDVVRAACDACMRAIRPGVPAWEPHEAARRVIEDAGCERGRVHTSGYGLAPGFPPTWGEPLHMLGGCDEILREGMVLSVEPPVFLDDEPLGARLIDNVVVTAQGCRRLTRYPRDLIAVE